MTVVDSDRNGEDTPLLAPSPRKPTPLPLGQIALLLLGQLTEPVTSQSILPYINELIGTLDIIGGDEKKVGYYAGLISSLYFAAEATTVLQWGRLSDRIGRKPVLLIGLMGMTLSTVLFGLSRTFWALVISRALCGALNGNIGVMKSAMGELTDETNRAQGFSLMPVMWAMGSCVGPFLGGVLSRPHDHFPVAFAAKFWVDFPYFLPCLAAASFTFAAAILVSLFFRETLNSHDKAPDTPSDASVNHGDQTQTGIAERKVPPLRSLLTRPVLVSIVNYSMLALLDIAVACMGPLFYSTPVELGGLGLSPASIGVFLGLFGVINGSAQLLLLARVVNFLGSRCTLFIAMAAFVPIFLWFPCANALAREGKTVWPAMGLQMFFMCIMDMAYAVTFMYVTASAPGRRSLGAVNGLAQTVVSVVRTIGPAASTSLFALSLERNLLGGYAVYVVLVALSLSSLVLVMMLPARPWHAATEE